MAQTSFLGSVIAGTTGAVKGAIGLGVIGAAVGAALGGIAALATGGIAIGAVGLGAAIGGTIGANVGGFMGAITGVVKSREAERPEAQDIVNVAKISFAQGVMAGQAHAMEQVQEKHGKQHHHAERLEASRAHGHGHQMGG